MRLFIAEKPSVGKAIAAELGGCRSKGGMIECGDSVVTWCFGHLLEQANPEDYDPALKRWAFESLPIVPAAWKLLPRKDASQQLALIGDLLKRSTEVVNAGDPDREGQLLVDEVLEHFGNRKPVQRLWLAAQDSGSVRKALAAIEDNAKYRPLMLMALARQRVDWIVGMNLTRAYTVRNQLVGHQGVQSVGRVQTPTLALVVARDREIENFKPQAYFTISADVEHVNGRFRARWKPAEGGEGLDAEGRLVSKPVADALVRKVSGKTGAIAKAEKKWMREGPPRLFALSTLTIKASAKYGFTADQVLKAAQALYETHKLTSYPRTDCEYLPETQFDERESVLAAIAANRPDLQSLVAGSDHSRRSGVWNDAKVTAHHGIAPTVQRVDLSALDSVERAIYDMVTRSYLAQFYPDFEYEQTSVEVLVEGETFAATGRVVKAEGWRTIYNFEEEDDSGKEKDEEDARQSLPDMKRGDPALVRTAARADKKTKAPPAFTEGTLIAAMTNIHKFVTNPEHKRTLKENAGLGTEATRAAIIETLKKRQFIEAKSKKLLSTPAGRALIDALPLAVKDPGLTAIFEDRLRGIERGELSIDAFLSQQIEFVTQRVAEAKAGPSRATVTVPAGPECPSCGKASGGRLRRIKGTKGFFWGCTRFRDGCSGTYPEVAGKPLLDGAKGAAAAAPVPCPSCGNAHGGTLRRINGPKGPFWGCSRYREGCKHSAADLKGKPMLQAAAR